MVKITKLDSILRYWWNRPTWKTTGKQKQTSSFSMMHIRDNTTLYKDALGVFHKAGNVKKRLFYFGCRPPIDSLPQTLSLAPTRSSEKDQVGQTKCCVNNQNQTVYTSLWWATLTNWLLCWLIRPLGTHRPPHAACLFRLLVGIISTNSPQLCWFLIWVEVMMVIK